VLGNAVDAAAWRLPVRPVDSDRLVVATVGRLAARKRPHPLLRILRRTRAQLPDRIRLEAVLIGDGPQRPRLDRYVQRHRMGAWVTFTGIATREEIRRAYRDVDLYIAPATLESFGIAALEARCAGLPVLARAQCGIADFIVDGVDGVLANDDDGLLDGLVRLAQDPVLRSAMRQHNSEVTPAFDWPDVMGRTEALYAQAISAAGRPDVPSAVAR
jgi:glycosyltransferase involved in cell wall biosynthesis